MTTRRLGWIAAAGLIMAQTSAVLAQAPASSGQVPSGPAASAQPALWGAIGVNVARSCAEMAADLID